jgi:hypothetical protein
MVARLDAVGLLRHRRLELADGALGLSRFEQLQAAL